MTKEELKKEAEEWIANNSKEFITNPNYSPFDYAAAIYLASAEPREKRIEELEKENAELKTKVIALENANRAMVKELDVTTGGGLSVLENVVRSKEQLSNAKELLNEFKRVLKEHNLYHNDLCTRTEQFISEVEK